MISIPFVLEAVYAICVDDVVYVGETANLYARIADHIISLENNRHSSPDLQVAYNENRSKLSMFILESGNNCNTKELRFELEAFWSDRLDSVNRYVGKSGKGTKGGKRPCKFCDWTQLPQNLKRHEKVCMYNPANM